MIQPVLGVDVGGTRAKFVVLGDEGQVLQTGEVPSDPHSAAVTMQTVANALENELGKSRDDKALTTTRLSGVGLACAGIVDPVRGWLGRSPNLPGWENSDLFAAVSRVFGPVNCAVANDVNSALYGEFKRGAGRGCQSLFMLALGTGVGGGVIVAGQLVLGSHSGAGEIGHMVLDPRGPVCTCGNRGCLEAYAGSVALLQAARKMGSSPQASRKFRELLQNLGDHLTTRDLATLATGGDSGARELFVVAGRKLGQAIGNLINLLDPERVIIGGGVVGAGDLILQPCRETAPGIVLCQEAREVPIVVAELGTSAAALGAGLMVRSRENSP